MKTKKILRTIAILMILASNIACDQVSKNIVRHNISYNEQISLIGKYMTLTKVENTGAFLSLGNSLSHPFKVLFLTILPLIFLVLAIIFLVTKSNISSPIILGICCIVGGGIGNIYDRALYGSVTDFLHMNFVLFQTGIFNMADVSVMIGTFILFTEFYFKRTEKHNSLLNRKTAQ